jgi:hypothetical protein
VQHVAEKEMVRVLMWGGSFMVANDAWVEAAKGKRPVRSG